MARPTLPTVGAVGWQDILNNGIYDVSDRADQALAQSGAGTPGAVVLDSFAGSGDDAKLTAAMSYAAAQTYPPPILLANRLHSFALQRTPYTGFRLRGPGAVNDAELSAANMGCQVNLTTSGPWLYINSADVWNAEVSGICFIGTSSTTFLGCDGTHQWRGSLLRNLSFKSFLTVLGTQAQKLLITTCLINGWFQVQGTYNGGVHLGGSDSRLFTDGALIDASVAYNTAGNAAGQFHYWLDGMDNSYVGPLYMTAEGPWGGVRVTGVAYNTGIAANRGMLWMYGATIEGRNTNQPCYGSLLRVEGGIVQMTNGYIARGMSNPSAMGHSPADAGVVMVTGGALVMNNVTYDRCAAVGETVPFVYVSGGVARVKDITVATTGGTWTGLPRVTAPGGSLVSDDTVTRV